MPEVACGARTVALLGSYAPSLIIFRGPLISELVRRGHRVVAMAPDIDKKVAGELRALGAEPREVRIANNALNPFSLPATMRDLQRAFGEVRPHTLIAYTIKPATLGVLAAARAGVPNIIPLVTGLGYAFTEGPGLKRRLSRIAATFLYRAAVARSRAVIFQNPDDRRFFEEHGMLPKAKRTAVVNGSGVDLAMFAPVPLPDEPRFLMMARLIADKGVREYASAAAELKRKYPHARFRLAGWFDNSPDAITREELEAMIVNGIEYLGKLDDVRPAIADSSVFVLPSRYGEGTPRSSLEAIAMGRPIITSDAPGCRETVVDGENGFLAKPRDAASVARAMERFILEPGLVARMGERSRILAERRFDVHQVNAAVLDAAGL